jgi:diguanylate cyclase (GGDEF)-like protein
MSFRTRLITFFLVIVLVPMIAMGGLVFRLISDSAKGKADARADGLAAAATSVYQNAAASARADAAALARDPALLHADTTVLSRLVASGIFARVAITRGGVTTAAGDPSALAPGAAQVRYSTGQVLTLTVSTLSARQFVRELSAAQAGVVVRQGQNVLAANVDTTAHSSFAPRATVTIDGVSYREITQHLTGWGGAPVAVTVLSSLAATTQSVSSSRLLAVVFIAAFLLLALAFAMLSSRALQGQLVRFLQAARRLGAGDFSSPVPAVGHDEFAALADEFNNMSSQLEHRLQELTEERARLRESVRRIGQTFESNLDRPALLELALKTALDATRSDCGRVSVRLSIEEPLAEVGRQGSLAGVETTVLEAERAALGSEDLGRTRDGDLEVLAAALRPMRRGSRAHGLITVARRGVPFGEDEAELLRSLASQAALALENVDLHLQVSRQAVTDELTGLANHGRFQELLAAEAEQVRRYHHPLGLIMLDLDNFKAINDTYGHQQGDIVLHRVGAVVHENSRDADWPARYGGEELALILPHTDLEGAYAIAERIRTEIQSLRIPRIDGGEPLRVTASVGVTSSSAGDKDLLIAEADAALYEAKRTGKNRTIRGAAATANVVGAE